MRVNPLIFLSIENLLEDSLADLLSRVLLPTLVDTFIEARSVPSLYVL
jgi:hypothetical protein